MKTVTLSLIFCFMGTILCGCVTGPTAKQLANANYGAPITKAEAQAKAEQWVRSILKDPDSARFEWYAFDRGWVNQGLLYGGGYLYGYQLKGSVNARNSFGGYTGRKQYLFMFHDGEIAAVWGEQGHTNGGLTTNNFIRMK